MFWGLFSEQLYLILVLFLLQDLLVKRQCPLVAGMSLFLTENLQETNCDALRDLLPFVQLKKHENTHGGVLLLALKVTLLHGCFSRFLNCTNVTKSRNSL